MAQRKLGCGHRGDGAPTFKLAGGGTACLACVLGVQRQLEELRQALDGATPAPEPPRPRGGRLASIGMPRGRGRARPKSRAPKQAKKGRRWSKEQRAKFEATLRRKKKEEASAA